MDKECRVHSALLLFVLFACCRLAVPLRCNDHSVEAALAETAGSCLRAEAWMEPMGGHCTHVQGPVLARDNRWRRRTGVPGRVNCRDR